MESCAPCGNSLFALYALPTPSRGLSMQNDADLEDLLDDDDAVSLEDAHGCFLSCASGVLAFCPHVAEDTEVFIVERRSDGIALQTGNGMYIGWQPCEGQ